MRVELFADHRFQGTDTLTQLILDAHSQPGDVYHVYSMRNFFFVDSKYEPVLRSAVVSEAQGRALDP